MTQILIDSTLFQAGEKFIKHLKDTSLGRLCSVTVIKETLVFIRVIILLLRFLLVELRLWLIEHVLVRAEWLLLLFILVFIDLLI